MAVKKALLDYVEDSLTHVDRLLTRGDREAAIRFGDLLANSAMSLVGDDLHTSRRALRLANIARSVELRAKVKGG